MYCVNSLKTVTYMWAWKKYTKDWQTSLLEMNPALSPSGKNTNTKPIIKGTDLIWNKNRSRHQLSVSELLVGLPFMYKDSII